MTAKPLTDVQRARLVAIAVDVETIGESATAAKYSVSMRTARRYRAQVLATPELAAEAAQAATELSKHWLEETASARRRLLGRMLELAAKAELGDLRHVVKAFQVVDESHTGELVFAKAFRSSPEDRDRANALAGALGQRRPPGFAAPH